MPRIANPISSPASIWLIAASHCPFIQILAPTHFITPGVVVASLRLLLVLTSGDSAG